MQPVTHLIADRPARVPPEHLTDPAATTPFFEIGAEGFLLRIPGGGRLHYAAGQGVALASPPGRGPEDLTPFVDTSMFGAAAWIDGHVPLQANALQLADGRLLLIAGARHDRREEVTAVLADALGLAAAAAPVVVTPDSPARACTNGVPMTLRSGSVTALQGALAATTGAPVRAGARCVPVALPVIDGQAVHPCAALISIRHDGVQDRQLETLGALAAIPQIKKHVFQPVVGTALWGDGVMAAARMVLADLMPVLRLSLPVSAVLDRDFVTWFMDQQDRWSGQ